MVKASHGRTVVGLPTLTKVGDHTKRTECLACVDAYQPLPYFSQAWHTPLVVLVWSTKVYQPADLSLNLGQNTITNHYHRGDGQGIDLSE